MFLTGLSRDFKKYFIGTRNFRGSQCKKGLGARFRLSIL